MRIHRVIAAFGGRSLWLSCVLLTACGPRDLPRFYPTPPVLGGVSAALPARIRGLVLLSELGCVACHASDSPSGPLAARRGPDLATLGARVHPGWIARFLADPHVVAPGTPMPDLLRAASPTECARVSEALAHYLRSFAPVAPAAEALDATAAERGGALFHDLGCAACHAPRDSSGAERAVPGSVPLGALAGKYPLPGLRAFLLAPHAARPSARMPDFHLSPAQAHDLASYLLAAPAVAPAPPAPAIEPRLVDAGRAEFAVRGCAKCHDLPDVGRAPPPVAKPLRELVPAGGCMSTRAGAYPFYPLSIDQRADLTAALTALAEELPAEQRVAQMLASRNCTACHARGELGGVSAERSGLFGTHDPSLGLESRLPPPLTGVGAKLQQAWLVDAIAHGQAERPYLRTRMPGFGAEFAAQLGELLANTDTLPPLEIAALPSDDKQARAITDLGRELVGDQGMACIACHTFAGERVGTMGAIDLVDSTAQRLRPQWFAHFLRAPFRFKPDTLMPQFFPDGKSVRPELGGGDAGKQIEALWHYLAEGRNVGKPRGMRRPPIEITVGTDAVLLRRSVQNTGKRGISVGYPSGVNITFDAERLGLNQVWWGKFLDAAPVWTGQGSGEARILGAARASLPNGPAFAVLAEPDAPWPMASRRELGQKFLGYDLDARQRPTFRYECEGVTIADAPAEFVPAGAPAEQKPLLRRTLQFTAAADRVLTFLAARDARVDDLGDGLVQVGSTLRLRLPPGSFRIRAAGDQRELLVAIALAGGRADLVIDYAWQETNK